MKLLNFLMLWLAFYQSGRSRTLTNRPANSGTWNSASGCLCTGVWIRRWGPSSATRWRVLRGEFVLITLEGTPQTKASALGYGCELVGHKAGMDTGLQLAPTPVGLVISAVTGNDATP